MIKFSIINLDANGIDVNGSEPASMLEIPDGDMISFDRPVEYRLRASAVNNGVLVKGSVNTTASAKCARCMSPFDLVVSNDDVCIFLENVDESEVDVTEQVREELLVNMPQNWVCSEDCKGLCPHCGKKIGVRKCKCGTAPVRDDVWKELDKLKPRLKK